MLYGPILTGWGKQWVVMKIFLGGGRGGVPAGKSGLNGNLLA